MMLSKPVRLFVVLMLALSPFLLASGALGDNVQPDVNWNSRAPGDNVQPDVNWNSRALGDNVQPDVNWNSRALT